MISKKSLSLPPKKWDVERCFLHRYVY